MQAAIRRGFCILLQKLFCMRYYPFLALIIFLSACQRENEGPSPLPAQTLLNTAYGADAAQKMDIYLPEGRSTAGTKVIVLIHGGGWSSGDKGDLNIGIDSLKKRLPDYAIFNINYRLASGSSNLFPAQENDVKAAIEFIISKSDEYAISQKLVLLGQSAGAHLALLHGYKNDPGKKVKAVVSFFGPTDLVAFYNANVIYQLILASVTGQTPAQNPSIYAQSSPTSFVNPQSPPTILLHGGADVVVPPSQSASLAALLQTNGVTHQYVFYPAEAHGWLFPTLTDSFNKIEAFLEANVN